MPVKLERLSAEEELSGLQVLVAQEIQEQRFVFTELLSS
jgi:hypothetical protein